MASNSQSNTNSYHGQALQEYRKILEDLENQCEIAAVMCHENSHWYWEVGFWTGRVGDVLLGISAVGGIAKNLYSTQWFKEHSVWALGIVVWVGLILGVCARTLTKFALPFSKYAKVYNDAAAEWQALQIKMKSILILVTDPQCDVKDCAQWLEEIGNKREQISKLANPEKWVYDKFQEPRFLAERENNLLDSNKRHKSIPVNKKLDLTQNKKQT